MTLSLRKYAAHRKASGLPGGTLRAVQEAIANGRLTTSLTEDKQIRDAHEADAEWAASTKADYVPLTGPSSPIATSSPATSSGNGLAEARARREAAQAELRELELAKQRGELLPLEEFEERLEQVEERMKTAFTRCRNKLLAIPARARQRDPSLSARQMTLLEGLVRDALVELADTSAEDDAERTG